MKKQLNYIKKIPLSPFLLVLFFCLHGVAENFGFIPLNEALRIGCFLLLTIITLFFLVFIFSRNIIYAGLITFFISLCYLFFGAIQDFLTLFPILHRYSILLPLLFAAITGAIIFFRKRFALQQRFTLYLNLLMFIYCFYDGISIVIKYNRETPFSKNIAINYDVIKQKPNVYFLLFDEYPGYQSLQDSFGFKNDKFYETLQLQHFVQMPIFSNYSATAYSMSSIFNMQYIPSVKNEESNNMQKQLQKRYKEIKNGLVFNIFKKLGYSINSLSIFDVQDHESLGSNSFVLGHSRLLTDKLFHNRFIKDLGWILITGKKSLFFFQKIFFSDIKDYNNKVTDNLLKLVHKKENIPQFTYCHFLLPHQPYFYDSAGKPNSIINLESDSVLRNKNLFLSYLKYSNKKIIDLTETIINNDSQAVIILMSDHGFRYYNSKGFCAYDYNNFCAIRYPAKKLNPIEKQFSNVNIFRYIFNEVFNQHSTFLRDSINFTPVITEN